MYPKHSSHNTGLYIEIESREDTYKREMFKLTENTATEIPIMAPAITSE